VTVKVDGTTATARSSFTVLQLIKKRFQPIVAGNYLDRFERGRLVGGGSPSGSSTLACSAISLTT
jgi:hypothetical protein